MSACPFFNSTVNRMSVFRTTRLIKAVVRHSHEHFNTRFALIHSKKLFSLDSNHERYRYGYYTKNTQFQFKPVRFSYQLMETAGNYVPISFSHLLRMKPENDSETWKEPSATHMRRISSLDLIFHWSTSKLPGRAFQLWIRRRIPRCDNDFHAHPMQTLCNTSSKGILKDCLTKR